MNNVVRRLVAPVRDTRARPARGAGRGRTGLRARLRRGAWLAGSLIVAVPLLLSGCEGGTAAGDGAVPQAASTAGVAASGAGAGTGNTIKVLTYNIRGGLRDGDPAKFPPIDPPPGPAPSVHPDLLTFVDYLAERIVQERPHIVALQEACSQQVSYLEETLRTADYPMTIATALPTTESTQDRARVFCSREPAAEATRGFGVAILTVGEAEEVEPPPGVDAGRVRGYQDRRRCVLWHGPRSVQACTYHVLPEEVPAIGRGLEPITRAEGPSRNQPVILTGDLNTQPHQPEMDFLYNPGDRPAEADPLATGFMYEVDTCRGASCGPDRYGELTTRAAKLDYVFADDRHFLPETSATVEWMQCGPHPERDGEIADCSDHAALWGEVTLSGPDFSAPDGLLNGTYNLECGGTTQSYQLSDGVAQMGDVRIILDDAQVADLNSDGDRDATVVLTCSLGASASQTLLLYEERDGQWQRSVYPDSLHASVIRNLVPPLLGSVEYETLDPVAGEPRCCPTGFEWSVYSINMDPLLPERIQRIAGPEVIGVDDPRAPNPAPGG